MGVHLNVTFFLVNAFNGLVKSENLGTNFQKYPIRPRNCFTSFGVLGGGIF